MAKVKTKKLLKRILTVILAVGLALGSAIGITTLVSKIAEDPLKTVRPIFKVGNISDKGEHIEGSKGAIFSELFECQGLTITPKFESHVSYKVFYYDADEKFLHKTESLSTSYKGAFPIAKYACIEITPSNDSKVSWYEVYKYRKCLKIEVNKEQDLLYSDNLFELASKGSYYGIDSLEDSYIVSNDGYNRAKLLDVKKCYKLVVVVDKVSTSENEPSTVIRFADDSKTVLSSIDLDKYEGEGKEILEASTGLTLYVLTMDLSKNYCYAGISVPNDVNCWIFAK